MARALALLDVDGVLNPEGKPEKRPHGYETYYVGPPVWHGHKPLRVWLAPEHGRILRRWAHTQKVELAWATTWAEYANEYIGAKIGLPELPVVDFGWIKKFSGTVYTEHWKFDGVLAHAEGQPLVWFDDDFKLYPQHVEWFMEQRGDLPTILIHVDPKVGLHQLDLDRATALLDEEVPRG